VCYRFFSLVALPFDEGHELDIVAAVMLLGGRDGGDCRVEALAVCCSFNDRAGFNLTKLVCNPDLHDADDLPQALYRTKFENLHAVSPKTSVTTAA
jgi:hypothetical protein